MSRNTTIFSLAAFGVLALGAAAIAQTSQPAAAPAQPGAWDPSARFAARDTNHDGFIDKTEASDRMLQHFDAIDADHDGRISQAEIRASWQARLAQNGGEGGWAGHHHGFGNRFAMMDTDHDGKVTLAEMTARTKARFDRLDANHDGIIDASEMPQPGQHKMWRDRDGNTAAGR